MTVGTALTGNRQELSPLMHLKDNSNGFILSFKGKEVFRHTSDSPCVELGEGTGRFRFYYGLFKIRDKKTRRLACSGYSIMENLDQRVIVNFSEGLTMILEVIDRRLHVGFETEIKKWNRIWLHWTADRKEKVYGGGEQYTHLNLRGRTLPVWIQEPGLGRGFNLLTLLAELKKKYGGKWYTSYFSQPTFVFTSGIFVHSESSAYSEGQFQKPDRHTLHTWEIPKKIVFGVEANPQSLMSSLTSFLGRQPKLPSWSYDGMWLGAQGGMEETRRKLKRMTDAGVKIAGLWCQDWEGIRITSFGKQLMWDWSFDENLYPNLPSYIEELKNEGIRYLGYINPFLALEGALYKEAAAKGYCVKNSEGKDYLVTITTFPAAMLDLTHPGCREWIKLVIRKNMIDTGLSGWMADFGEYIPTDAVFHDGSDGLTYHNRYIVEWARINHEAVIEAGKEDEIAFFMRAGYTGSAKYSPSFWNGDQLVNWNRDQGFPTLIPGSVSLGFTGVGYVHSDLGGYTTVMWLKRSRELIMRWAEQAVFTQTMRSHEGNRPDVGASLHRDDLVLPHLAKMSAIFTALKPYHQALSDEYQETGVPPMSHPWIHYPKDEELHSRRNQYQYMYGPDLMVAPVIYKGHRKRRLYLPHDEWIHLWSGSAFAGGTVKVQAPIGKPAVFYRRKSQWKSLFEGLKKC